MANTTVYETLDRQSRVTRLLELHPSAENDKVRCTLTHHNLESLPPYEALSYRWGPDTEKVPLAVGQSHIRVTPSLVAALRRLREPETSRFLWIDQVCINQEDNNERSHQVGLMGDIYRQAKRIVIWLGEEEATAKALAFMRDFEVIVKSSFENNQYDLLHSNFTDENLRSEMANILRSVFADPYFERYWIIQEVVLSREAIIASGSSTVDWNTAIQFLTGLRQYNPPLLGKVRAELNMQFTMDIIPKRLAFFRESEEAKISWNLIVAFRYSQAKVASDKIYALLGLCNDWKDTGFTIDYERNDPETYTLFTRAMMEKEGRLRWLAHAGSPRRFPDLPSWVPDLTLSMGKPDVISLQPGLFAADKGAAADFYFSPDSSTLYCNGVCVDSVAYLTTRNMLGICADGLWYVSIDDHVDYFTLYTCSEMAKVRYGDDFRAVLQSMCTAERGVPLHGKGAARTKKWMPVATILADDTAEDAPELTAWVNAMKLIMESTLNRRAIFISTTGYIGLMPEYAQEGDIIAVVFGHDVPVVLRKEEDYYRFIGEW